MSKVPQSKGSTWLCVQAGHREMYGVPRALQRAGVLDSLITDIWVPPGSVLGSLARGALGRRLRDRHHKDLPRGKVRAHSWQALAWEAACSLRGINGRRRMLAQNDWWGETAARMLESATTPTTRYVFSYCYNARPLFRKARERGLLPVLGQIDPAFSQDRKVAEIVGQWPAFRNHFQPGSDAFFESWREECRLAEWIVVNSEWSRTGLVEAGIEADKIIVCPLIYSPPPESNGWIKSYPETFSHQRPLRVLCLGRVTLLKGVAETIEAARRLVGRPVEFTFVGNSDIEDFSSHIAGARIRHVPRVSRAECHAFYREADVFLFPSHTDGFGLTQLEAQAWKLPIIASRFCAEVAAHGRTGWILSEVSGVTIAGVIEEILKAPIILRHFSSQIMPWTFGLEELGRRLNSVGDRRETSA